MSSRRTVLIAVALVLAALAAGGVVYYGKTADSRAYQDATLVQVFKVVKPIPKGLSGDDAIGKDYIRSSQIPQEFRPGSSVTNLENIKAKVAVNDISPGQVVVDEHFLSRAQAQVTFAQQIPPGQVAVSVSVDKIHGVAGLLQPGDKVNLMVAEKTDDNTEVETLFQNVNILNIGSTPTAPGTEEGDNKSDNAAQAADSGLITFAVPLDAAQRIALVQSASDRFTFYAVLVPPDNVAGSKPSTVTSGNLFSGTGNTPYPGQ